LPWTLPLRLLNLGSRLSNALSRPQLSVLGTAELDTTEQVWVGVLLPPFDVKFGCVLFDVPRVVDSGRSKDCGQSAVVMEEPLHADCHGVDIEEEGAVNSIVDL
jgi:hypothetical protein